MVVLGGGGAVSYERSTPVTVLAKVAVGSGQNVDEDREDVTDAERGWERR